MTFTYIRDYTPVGLKTAGGKVVIGFANRESLPTMFVSPLLPVPFPPFCKLSFKEGEKEHMLSKEESFLINL